MIKALTVTGLLLLGYDAADLIITGMAGLGGVFSIAGHYKIPVIQAYVVPFAPTQEFATPLVPSLPSLGTGVPGVPDLPKK